MSLLTTVYTLADTVVGSTAAAAFASASALLQTQITVPTSLSATTFTGSISCTRIFTIGGVIVATQLW